MPTINTIQEEIGPVHETRFPLWKFVKKAVFPSWEYRIPLYKPIQILIFPSWKFLGNVDSHYGNKYGEVDISNMEISWE